MRLLLWKGSEIRFRFDGFSSEFFRFGPIIPGEIHELDTESNSRIVVYLKENVKIKATIFSSLRCNGTRRVSRRYPASFFPPDEGRITLRVWRALGIRFRGASELFEVQIKSSLVSRRLVPTLRIRCRFAPYAVRERVSESDSVKKTINRVSKLKH